MAAPNDRKVIWGSHVVPQESFSTTSTQVTREDGSTAGTATYTDYKLDTTVAKRFGGKGSVDITSDQVTDLWTSMVTTLATWSSIEENWNETSHTWVTLATGAVAVDDSLSPIRTGSTAIKF